jgi:heavy metal sensor kinase
MTGLVKLLRGLRFRLALSYVLFFGVLLTAIGLGFRHNLKNETEAQVRTALEEAWEGAQAFLKVVGGQPVWEEDSQDPNFDFIKERLRLVHVILNRRREVLSISPVYASMGVDSRETIDRIIATGRAEVYVRRDEEGAPYMIKAGRIYGDRGNPYFFAIGRSLESSEQTVRNFTETYFLALPFLIALTSLLGWLLAGRALMPVNAVSQAAQTITGSNLNLQIPERGAGDELDNLIQSFNRMTARLNQNFEQVRRFSTDVSHELRTPLTTIRGQLEVALFTAQTHEQYREAMVNALEAVEQLSSIVRALLLLSQAESGQLVLQRNPLNLGDVARDLVEQFQIPAEEKQLSLTACIEPGVVVPADRVQVERLLSNLLSNAVKYTPPGGSVVVTVSHDPARAHGCIEVEDTGVGIPEENLTHIFDRFYRVRDARSSQEQGLGLGLSFVAWIAKAHNGRVEVSSKVGEGSRFRVLLPAAPPERAPRQDEPAPALERRVQHT